MIDFLEIEPNARLSNYIDSYWVASGSIGHDPINYHVLPDCCTDIILNLGDTILSSNNTDHLNRHQSYLIGTSTKFSEVSLMGSIDLVGIRFKPLGLKAFIPHFHLGELKNQMIEVNIFEIDRIFNGKNPTKQSIKHQLDAYLLHIIQQGYTSNNIISTAIQIIKQRQGLLKISELSWSVNTSERNLERLFSANIGLTPKEFSRITRLMNVKKALRNEVNKDLSQVAFDFNYYDQSHFTKDFFDFAGELPSTYK
jgi:AraC-like DNA-binding protein